MERRPCAFLRASLDEPDHESNFRIQSYCAFVLLVFCVIVRPSILWCAIFLGFTSLVLALEMLNTALEALVDKLHPEQNPQIGYIKDCAAGAVLIASTGALIAFILFIYTEMT
jgi:undecaprenol kinase